MTSDGKPYGPTTYKKIVQECFMLTKHLNTSYTDLYKISPLERKYLLEFLSDDLLQQKNLIDSVKDTAARR